ncbi:MAG: hypothetical protein ACO2PM_23570 [Pyrobaculum sp.]|jgi:hypothetical protein
MFAVAATLLDLIASYQVALINAHAYISSAPILALLVLESLLASQQADFQTPTSFSADPLA